MSRVTHKILDNMVHRLNLALNRPTTYHVSGQQPYQPNHGHLYIDHNAAYGGYVLEELDGSGVRHPLGMQRHSAQEMYAILYAIRQVVDFGELKPFPQKSA